MIDISLVNNNTYFTITYFEIIYDFQVQYFVQVIKVFTIKFS